MRKGRREEECEGKQRARTLLEKTPLRSDAVSIVGNFIKANSFKKENTLREKERLAYDFIININVLVYNIYTVLNSLRIKY